MQQSYKKTFTKPHIKKRSNTIMTSKNRGQQLMENLPLGRRTVAFSF